MLGFWSDKDTVKISPQIVVFTVFFLLGLYFFYFIRSIVTLLFLAFIIMVALNPLVTFLQKRLRFPRILATFLVYILLIALIAVIVAIIIPPLTSQLYQLFINLHLPPSIQSEINNYAFTLDNFGSIIDRVSSSVGLIFTVVTSTFSSIFTVFTLLVMSFHLMLQRPNLHKKIYWFTKDESRVKLAKDFLDSLEVQLGGWVRGEFLLMILIGLGSYIGLLLVGVPYALPLAILAGLLEILPNIGPTLSAVPAILIGYSSGGPVMAGAVAILYVIVQAVENNLIVPKIMRDNVDVNPLTALVSILIGIKLGGVTGALLAIPTYIVLRSAYSMWFKAQKPSP